MKIINDFKKNIWNIKSKHSTPSRALWTRLVRLVLLITHGFKTRQVQQGASSLTYYTLLSVVPIFAFLIAIARALLVQAPFQAWVEGHFIAQKPVLDKLLEFADTSLAQARHGIIAIPALAIALWAGIKMLTHIEFTFNQIWGVPKGRKLSRCFSDYLAILFFCPLVLIFSSLLTILVSAAASDLGKEGGVLSAFGPIFYAILNAIPLILTGLLLTFLYIFMPNTEVRFFPALIAGLLTATSYQVVQWLYLYLQIGLSHYNAIYGTFAALPLFIIWVHLSWAMILIGAKLTFAFQNISAYDITDLGAPIAHRCLNLLCLRIAHACVQDFVHSRPPVSSSQLSARLQISLPLTHTLLTRLINANVLVPVTQGNKGISGYQPAVPLDELTIKRVIDMLESQGEIIEIPFDKDLKTILTCLDEFSGVMANVKHNVLLKDF